jgi:integrase
MLKDSVLAYLTLRRAAGFRLRNDEDLLLDYARYAAARGEDHIRSTSAIDWAGKSKSLIQRGIRLRTVIRFARHVRAEDPGHELPPGHVFPAPIQRRLPHIFEPEEIRRLMVVAGKMGPKGSIRPRTYQTLLGLLASCGLRVSEALHLKVEDITEDGLCIRETKFRKTRMVPMHESTERALKEYLGWRQKEGGTTGHLLVSPHGDPLTYMVVSWNFRNLLRAIGLRGEKGQGPHLHDLRHTATVRSLESCPPDQVANHMLALSTYLGHSKLANTYWYIHATPHLMVGIANACRSQLEEDPL